MASSVPTALFREEMELCVIFDTEKLEEMRKRQNCSENCRKYFCERLKEFSPFNYGKFERRLSCNLSMSLHFFSCEGP